MCAELTVSPAGPGDLRGDRRILAAGQPPGAEPPLLRPDQRTAREGVRASAHDGGQDRQEVIDSLPGELDLEAARQVAILHGQTAFDGKFAGWRRRVGAPEHGLPLELTGSAAETVHEQERIGFDQKWEAAVREIFLRVSDIREDLAATRREAVTRLRELTDGLWDDVDRQAGLVSEQERFTELFEAPATSFKDHLSDTDRALLDGFKARDTTPSDPGRRQVLHDGLDTLRTSYERQFPAGEQVSEESLALWRETFDKTVESLPSRLATQTAREAALRRSFNDLETRHAAWERDPGLSKEFRERFGLQHSTALGAGDAQSSMQTALGRSVNDRFGELFTGEQERSTGRAARRVADLVRRDRRRRTGCTCGSAWRPDARA